MIDPNITYYILFGTAVLSYIFEKDREIIDLNDQKDFETYMKYLGLTDKEIEQMRKTHRKSMKDNAKNKRKKERD